MTSQLSAADRAALKTATRVLVAEAGGLDAASLVARLQRSALALTYDPHRPDRMAPVDVVADLEQVAAGPHVTATLARLAGHRLVPIPRAAGRTARAIAEVFRSASDLGAAYARAMEDTRITAAERRRLRDEVLDLLAACEHAAAVLSQEEEPPHG